MWIVCSYEKKLGEKNCVGNRGAGYFVSNCTVDLVSLDMRLSGSKA